MLQKKMKIYIFLNYIFKLQPFGSAESYQCIKQEELNSLSDTFYSLVTMFEILDQIDQGENLSIYDLSIILRDHLKKAYFFQN